MSCDIDFSDIAPYSDEEFPEKMKHLVREPEFERVIKSVMPGVDYAQFTSQLLSVKDKNSFQRIIIRPFLERLEATTTDGITIGGLENISRGMSYTFMSNHRDIVLDASFLNFSFIKHDMPTSEIAIGNNLLIYDWITDLVKLNKSFIVKRNLRMIQALEAARQLSAYIHYAINEKKESVWIAQREGRAKDSNDLTQESLVKMLGLEGGGSLGENLMGVHIVPLAISYEYDPNDYLKVTEFLMRRRNPEFKKSQHDDLLSMETGILQYKGKVHFQLGKCIDAELEALSEEMDRTEYIKHVCAIIDRSIHSDYKIYPINYIAFDEVNNTDRFRDYYTAEDRKRTDDYIASQLAKVEVTDITDEERDYMRHLILSMYANPLINKLAVIEDNLL
ncbi:MAG: acyltransferase [Paramuribaculum sp.]|nr:acyltransferase [Paramuribaculum sp.]